MKIFLAGVAPWRESGLYDDTIKREHPFILESFYYVNNDTVRLLPHYGDFLLDSGAFTFMEGGAPEPWERYIDEYAEFIVRNHVEKFFELDIDSIVGYDTVLKYRERLERAAGRRCIPVWHKSRGMTEYKRMCDEYPYVAIGGYVVRELDRNDYNAFPAMIRYAHLHGARVHGLGFTRLGLLKDYHFDSVDSTAWTTGNRYGFVYRYDGVEMRKIDAPKGKRIGVPREVALHNFKEWIKLQKRAESLL